MEATFPTQHQVPITATLLFHTSFSDLSTVFFMSLPTQEPVGAPCRLSPHAECSLLLGMSPFPPPRTPKAEVDS